MVHCGTQLSLLGGEFEREVELLRANSRSLSYASKPDGGAFQYEACRRLFMGRTGLGPLRVAFDTAILIDYGIFGEEMWSDEDFDPDVDEPRYRAELVALAKIFELWLSRDIRLHTFEEQLRDAKKALSGPHSKKRQLQVRQLAAALECLDHGARDPTPQEWESLRSTEALLTIGGKADGELVRLAYNGGCHVFLTRDHKVLNRADLAAEFCLRLLTPSQLRLYLTECSQEQTSLTFGDGEMLMSDSHKWAHGFAACEYTV